MVKFRWFPSIVVAAALCAGLAACESVPPRQQFPEITFSHLPRINLDVARIEVVQAYKAPGAKPNVEHLFPVAPASIAERWARQRLRAVGAGGSARATVVSAAVVEVPLKRTTGLRGAFTTDQSERYEGVLEMKIELAASGARARAAVTARTELSRTVPENISLNDREKLWFQMTEEMANQLNVLLEREIKKHFKAYLR